MELKNKKDGKLYHVRTEDDQHGGFMVFASEIGTSFFDRDFCMHYRTLAELCEEWEDIEN